MTERVLSDDEIGDITVGQVGNYAASFGAKWMGEFARAVEAEVLAKVAMWPPKLLVDGGEYVSRAEMNSQLKYLREKAEHAARRRERAAWSEGRKSQDRFREYGLSTAEVWRDRDTLYPLPTVTRPRTVTLSDGAQCTVIGTAAEREPWRVFRAARTPDDARKLADLVEHPMEEVSE